MRFFRSYATYSHENGMIFIISKNDNIPKNLCINIDWDFVTGQISLCFICS